MSLLAVIGGTGLDQFEGLTLTDSHAVSTPYGEPSRAIEEGRLDDHKLMFLHRHGSPQAIPPHLVNYRANLWALRSLGVTDVIGINAVGGIGDGMFPGRLIIPDQIIDYTWGREHTVDTGEAGSLQHIDFTEPYSEGLRQGILEAAAVNDIAHAAQAVHGVMQGPRLETAAEIRKLAADGCDIVGMTGMPEAALARELGLNYACICMVVNRAAGLGDKTITLETIFANLQQESVSVRRLLSAVIDAYYCA